MSDPQRFASEEDFLQRRTFCVVLLTVSPTELRARVLSRHMLMERDQARCLRLNPYGTIDSLELAKIHRTAESPYHLTGVLVDYSENLDALLQVAATELRRLHTLHLEQLDAHRARFVALDLVVEG